jgi:hypothetical protein
MRNYLLIGLALLAVGCSTQHTVGAGNPSLGVVSITGPSDNSAPTSGRLSVSEAALLTGAPFVGPTTPEAVPPGTPGTLTVHFLVQPDSNIQAELKFRAGVYDFDFVTTNISGNLQNAMIHYGGQYAGEHGSCTDWVSSNVVFTPGLATDTLTGHWEADCHHSDLARAGDRGTFALTRPGTLAPPPPPPPPSCPAGTHGAPPQCVPNEPPPPPPPPVVCVPPQVLQGGVCVTPPPPVCSGAILGGIEVRTGNTWGSAPSPLDHNGYPQARVSVTLTPPGCAPATITGTSDVEWLTIDHNQDQPGYLLFNVVGNSSKTDTRTGHLTINGQTVTITQDHK